MNTSDQNIYLKLLISQSEMKTYSKATVIMKFKQVVYLPKP